MVHYWFLKSNKMLIGLLVLALTLVVACGTAAPEVVEREVIKEVPVEVMKEVEVIREVEVPVEVEKEVLREVEVIKEVEVEVLKEVPKETVIERTVIATPTPIPVSMEQVDAKVTRVIYAFGELIESNRHWTVGRPSYYQFDPYGETLVGLDAQTNARNPRLAKSWEFSPNGREWTFHLEEDVPFHFGYGEFTAKDVLSAFERNQSPESQAGSANFFKETVSIEAVNDYEVKWTMNFPAVDMVAQLSRGFGGGEILMLSSAQFEQDGLEGFDQRPAGTGSYQYGGRKIGQSIWFEKAPQPHWRGENPDFEEVEIRFIREDVTRLAMLLTAEAHIATLSRELQLEAARRGMQPASAGVPTNFLTLFFGGMWFIPGDADYDPDVPWANPVHGKTIRQAINKAINRDEMMEHVLRGEGEIMLRTSVHPVLGAAYNPQWEEDWEELYGYDPDKARELMAEAGYTLDNPMKLTIHNYISSDEPETAVMVEAMINYLEPIGVKATIRDTDWGTVRKNYREKTDFIKNGAYGNVITMRTLTTRLRGWSSFSGNSHRWETEVQDQAYRDFLALKTIDRDVIDGILRKAVDEQFYEFADVPFFWFRLTVMFNPEVVESWTFPGTAASKTSHWDLLKAAQ